MSEPSTGNRVRTFVMKTPGWAWRLIKFLFIFAGVYIVMTILPPDMLGMGNPLLTTLFALVYELAKMAVMLLIAILGVLIFILK